jgi:hypothetical protein
MGSIPFIISSNALGGRLSTAEVLLIGALVCEIVIHTAVSVAVKIDCSSAPFVFGIKTFSTLVSFTFVRRVSNVHTFCTFDTSTFPCFTVIFVSLLFFETPKIVHLTAAAESIV